MVSYTATGGNAVGTNRVQAPYAPNSSRPNASSLAFPRDLQKQPYWFSFSFYQYKMPSLVQQNAYFLDAGTIRLPMPNSMTDSQHVTYNAESLDVVSGLAANQFAANPNSAKNVALTAGVAGLANVPIPGVKESTAGIIQGLADSNIGKAALQSQGAAVNPFLTVMFKSPSFKVHSFSWKLAPSNVQESQILNKIINTFRANMLPDQTGALGGTLLTYPNIVQISVSVNQGTYFSYAFKPAVVQSFDINFAPSGQPSFFGSTKAPTEVEIRLGLMEIEYWLSSDYGLNGSFGGKVLNDFISGLDTIATGAKEVATRVGDAIVAGTNEVATAPGGLY
jgi:hypothetical protein